MPSDKKDFQIQVIVEYKGLRYIESDEVDSEWDVPGRVDHMGQTILKRIHERKRR